MSFWHSHGGLLGPVAALGSSITWAYGSAVYTQQARRVGALEVNFTRALLVLPLYLLASLVLFFDQGPAPFAALRGERVGFLLLSTLCSYGIGDMLFYQASMRLGVPTALAIASVYPVWATLLGALHGEAVGRLRLLGTLACFLGVAWLVLLQPDDQPVETAAQRRRGQRWSGVALAALTSLLWAGNTYAVQRGATGVSMWPVNTLRYGMATVLLGALYLMQRRRSAAAPTARLLGSLPEMRRFLPTVAIEAFCGSAIFVYGVSHADLSVAAPLSSLAPLFAVPIGLWHGSERLEWRRLLAITVTVAGVVLLVS